MVTSNDAAANDKNLFMSVSPEMTTSRACLEAGVFACLLSRRIKAPGATSPKFYVPSQPRFNALCLFLGLNS
jgi:hypothetical protein